MVGVLTPDEKDMSFKYINIKPLPCAISRSPILRDVGLSARGFFRKNPKPEMTLRLFWPFFPVSASELPKADRREKSEASKPTGQEEALGQRSPRKSEEASFGISSLLQSNNF